MTTLMADSFPLSNLECKSRPCRRQYIKKVSHNNNNTFCLLRYDMGLDELLPSSSQVHNVI